MDDAQRYRIDKHAIQAQIILAATSAEGEYEEGENYVLAYSGLVIPTFNFFIPLTLTGLTDETLADASAFFRTRQAQYAINLEEHRVPDGTEYLSRRRYLPLPPQPIMAIDALSNQFAPVDKFIIEPVTTIPRLTAFYTLLEKVFDYTINDIITLYPVSQLSVENVQHFVGFTDENIPVTAATAVYTNDVVSIWNLCTVDEFRRHGYAAALVNYILVNAYEQHYTLSLTYATPMSFSLCNHLGYKLYAMRQWFLPSETTF